jgi:hypothetical protein
MALFFIGINDSSSYWLGSIAVIAPLLDLRSPGFEPRSGQSFLFLQARVRRASPIGPGRPPALRSSFNSHSGQLSILYMENGMENGMENVTWPKHITIIPHTLLNTLCLHFPNIL